MAKLASALRWWSYASAIGAVTLTPLAGFVVGDKRPSAVASAFQMLIAVVLMLASLAASIVDRQRRRISRATEIQRRALARGAGRDPDDRFAASREQAHAAGLPWVESDGSITRPNMRASS